MIWILPPPLQRIDSDDHTNTESRACRGRCKKFISEGKKLAVLFYESNCTNYRSLKEKRNGGRLNPAGGSNAAHHYPSVAMLTACCHDYSLTAGGGSALSSFNTRKSAGC